VHEILAGGPPWNTTVCIRITDQAAGSNGEVVYENRAVLFGKVRWGKIVFYEVYEDTQKVAELDQYLARQKNELVRARSRKKIYVSLDR